jgi:hypothetical protein
MFITIKLKLKQDLLGQVSWTVEQDKMELNDLKLDLKLEQKFDVQLDLK